MRPQIPDDKVCARQRQCGALHRWRGLRPALAFACACLVIGGCSGAATAPTVTSTPVELMQITVASTPTPIVKAVPPTQPPTPAPTQTPTPAPEEGIVVGVIDGDTLTVLVDGEEKRVRLLGIDAPPLNVPLGPLAAEAAKALVQGRQVRLERDVTPWDSGRRLLRYVYLIDDDLFVNAELVREGWAVAAVAEPDTAQKSVLESTQDQAAAASVGIWVGKSGPATNQPATLYAGPGLEFPVVSNLPTNTALQIDASSPDGQWFRIGGSAWIPDFFVTNAPPVQGLQLASVPTPTPNYSPTPVPPTREPTLTPTPRPTFAIGAIKIVQLDRLNEFFVLRNDTTGAIALTDWKMKSEDGGEICFLSGVIGPGGVVRFWTQVNPPPPDYSCNLEWEMWADLADDNALLFDPSGQVVDIKLNPIYTAPVDTPTPAG